MAFSNINWEALGGGAYQGYNNNTVATQNGVPVNDNQNMPTNADTEGPKWWEGGNVKGYADSLAVLFNAFSGKPDGPDTVVYQQETADQKRGLSTGALIAIVIGIITILILVLVLAFRKRKSA